MSAFDVGELERLAMKMRAWDEEDLAGEQECVRCCAGMCAPGELDPSPLCNLCAQTVAGDLPDLVARIRALEAALGEAVERHHCGNFSIEDNRRLTAVLMGSR